MRYNEAIINDAIKTGLLSSESDIPKFRYAHYIGMTAIVEYYTNVPKSMMSVIYKPNRDSGTRVINKLKNFQYDGQSIDKIISDETSILREQIYYYNIIMILNSNTPVLTKDGKYTLPIHSTEQITESDQDFLNIREVILEELEKSPNLLRTRADVELFMEKHPQFKPNDEYRIDKLITYLILRKIL